MGWRYSGVDLYADAGCGRGCFRGECGQQTVSGEHGSETGCGEGERGGSISAAPDIAPLLAGKYFGGWYLGEERFAFDTALLQDTTLTAKWLDAPAAPDLVLKNNFDNAVSLYWDCAAETDIKEYRSAGRTAQMRNLL